MSFVFMKNDILKKINNIRWYLEYSTYILSSV